MDKFFKQLEAYVRSLTATQRVLLGVSASLVLGIIALFVRLTDKADYRTLYSGLAAADAQAVAQRLAAKNVPYELSPDGTAIRVPADQLDRTRLDLASEGMPQSGRLGFELFDKPNWAGSDFSEQVNYQRALEGELERTVQTLGNVESVRVHLVLPHDSLFTDRERVAKAAVVMKLRGGQLSDDEANAVTHLVSSAVDNLSPDNVTLIGADGRTPLVAKGRGGSNGHAPPVELETAMAEKLVSTLAPIVGPDHVKASVTVAYDQSSGETTQETYDPANPVLVSSQIQEEKFGGAPPAGIPGTPSNVPANPTNNAPTGPGGTNPAVPNANPQNAQNGQSAQNPTLGSTAGVNGQATQTAQIAGANPNPLVSVSAESEGQRSESKTFAVSKTLRHTIDPSGKLQKVAAAVLVDDVFEETKDDKGQVPQTRRKRTPEEMKQLEDLARAAIGFDSTRGDVLSVQNVSFLVPPVERIPPTPMVERVRLVADKWVWVARYLALFLMFLVIYFLVLRPVKKKLLASFEAVRPAPQLAAAAAGGSAQAGVALPSDNPRQTDADFERELNETTTEVQRVVKLKRHLSDKVKREPLPASQLIRHWIHEGEKV